MEAIEIIKPQQVKAPEKASAPAVRKEKAPKEEAAKSEESKEKSAQLHRIQEAKTEQVAESIKKYVDSLQTDLKIQVHRETGKIMIKVISKEDGKVVREVPPEKLLNLAAKMEEMTGLLFDEKV